MRRPKRIGRGDTVQPNTSAAVFNKQRKDTADQKDDQALEEAFRESATARSATVATEHAPSYAVGQSPLHNRGLFAAQSLRAGDMILDEKPLLERPYDLLDADGNKAQPAFNRYFDDIRRMTAEDKQAFLRIMVTNEHNYENIGDFHDLNTKLEAIMTPTYPTAIQLATTFRQHGFPFCSTVETHRLYNGDVHRLNHSCEPNAEAAWNPETKRMAVRAIKNVAKAQEITIAYIDLCQPRAQRFSCLGFGCRCSECRPSDPSTRLSELDDDRETLAITSQHLYDFESDFFGVGHDVMIVTPSRAKAIIQYPGLDDLINITVNAHTNIKVRDKMEASSLALAYEVRYVVFLAKAMTSSGGTKANYAEQAFGSKLMEVEQLAICMGIEHPRTRQSITLLRKVANGQKRRKERVWKMLDRYA